METFDLLIIGAGCAGASGAMYAARMNLKTVILGEMPGGLITTTHLVENWPGIISISGPDLAQNLLDHAKAFGVENRGEKVLEIEKVKLTNEDSTVGISAGFKVKTSSKEYMAKAVLIATGSEHKHMGIPGEENLTNKGVSYCALCDGAFYKGKEVVVVGGGDSAAKEALLLSEFCPKVYVVCRSTFRPEPINADRVKNNPKIEVILQNQPVEVLGENSVTGLKLKDERVLDVKGVFVAIGHLPLSELALHVGVELNEKNEIMINRRSETNIPGIFAAGDVCDTQFKQAITGSAEAVTAAYFAFEYLNKTQISWG